MDKNKSLTHSHLFTMRLWVEESGASGPHWCGKLQDMADGNTAYFQGLQMLIAVLQRLLPEEPGTGVQAPPAVASSKEA